MKRKYRITLWALTALLLCIIMPLSSVLSAKEAPAAKRLLVLGFRSPLFDQVQERYLRSPFCAADTRRCARAGHEMDRHGRKAGT